MENKLKTKEKFVNKIKEYVNVCKNKKELPNIAGFCVYCDIVTGSIRKKEAQSCLFHQA